MAYGKKNKAEEKKQNNVAPKKKRTVRRVLTAVFIFLLVPAGYFLVIFGNGNFHAVTPGEAYRCDQPDYSRLEYYRKTCGIRSIVNLRGSNPGSKWYRDEIRFSAANGIKHYDIALSATSIPTAAQMNELLAIIKTAPRPVLIHCKSGADRSGLLAAMWKEAADGQSKAVADEQLSIRYGHIPFGATTAMDHAFLAWQPAK